MFSLSSLRAHSQIAILSLTSSGSGPPAAPVEAPLIKFSSSTFSLHLGLHGSAFEMSNVVKCNACHYNMLDISEFALHLNV